MTGLAVLIDQLFSPVPGGMGTYTRELVAALTRADPSLEIALFHSRFGRPPPEPWTRGYPVHEVSHPIRRLYPSWALLGRPPLPPAIRRHSVLHTPLPVAVPPPARGQRLVVTVHDLAFLVHPEVFPPAWRLLYRAALRRAVRSAHAVVAPSRSTAEDLVRRGRAPASRVHVVPLAASLPARPSDPEAVLARLRLPRPYVLFVGTLEPRKNVLRLARAYRRLAARGIPHALVLAGPVGWHAQPLLREAARGMPGEIVMTGSLPPADLDAVYRGADAFVYPSLYEGFGLPVVEAMARGLPCVVSTSSSLPEVAGEAALRVDPRSQAAIADALERVVTDRALADRLRQAALIRAASYSWDRTARETLEVYKATL